MAKALHGNFIRKTQTGLCLGNAEKPADSFILSKLPRSLVSHLGFSRYAPLLAGALVFCKAILFAKAT